MGNVAITRGAVIFGAIFIPLAIQYAIAIVSGRGCSIFEVFFFEVAGFAFLTLALRRKFLFGFLAACLYFPLMFIAAFLIGWHSGYYDAR